MKKTILVLVALALLIPASAFAATEFSLGGFIKLDGIWDSTQNPKTALAVIARNNDQQFHHGHFLMTAQGSRFNFTIKGPKLWGATTTGFIEMDFDGSGDARMGPTHNYLPRLRHAMFRLNWPETELLFGQYWGMFSEFAPENPGDADMAFHGWFLNRVPQIRLTQKFAGAWTVAGAICKPYDPGVADNTFINQNMTVGQVQYAQADANIWNGQSSETPQIQAKVAYEQDLWGKAPFWGRPRGFTAQLSGAWQRTRYQSGATAAFGGFTFGQNFYGTPTITQHVQQYLDPWALQATLFVPVLPTYSNNLAGSASITAQYYIGQGCSFIGLTRDNDNSWFDFAGLNAAGNFLFNRKLTNQWGGYVQGQYWFTNEWYTNVAYGFNKNYGFDQATYASNNDQTKNWQEVDVTLYYRPIAALKFGLTYAYERTDFLQNTVPVGQVSGATNVGESHRLEFTAYWFF